MSSVSSLFEIFVNIKFNVKYIYEIIHICTAVVYEVKNDHRSKFSNLSNWK